MHRKLCRCSRNCCSGAGWTRCGAGGNFTDERQSGLKENILTECGQFAIIPRLLWIIYALFQKAAYKNIESGVNQMDKKNILTYEGLKKLEDELQNLKVVKRKEVAQKIKEAREQGDLSENAEYDAAKDEQRDIEARIEEIEKILKNAEVVVEEEVDLEKISIGCKVKILDCEFNDELEYKIVGSTEANSLKGKISNESPVGRALLGKKVGDTITVETQAGELSYKVLEIQRSTVD